MCRLSILQVRRKLGELRAMETDASMLTVAPRSASLAVGRPRGLATILRLAVARAQSVFKTSRSAYLSVSESEAR